MLLPLVLPTVVIAVAWKLFYNPLSGPLTGLFRAAHLEGLAQDWLGDPKIALPALMVPACWASFGLSLLLFEAVLGGINSAVLVAAAIDGAGAWSRLRRITLPALRDTLPLAIVTLPRSWRKQNLARGSASVQHRYFHLHALRDTVIEELGSTPIAAPANDSWSTTTNSSGYAKIPPVQFLAWREVDHHRRPGNLLNNRVTPSALRCQRTTFPGRRPEYLRRGLGFVGPVVK